MKATALIAEDEPILAQALSSMLKRHWPDLTVLPVAADGGQAVDMALAEWPEVMFMDIQMPYLNGLDAAEQIMEQWPTDRPLPLLVFVTAYDEYAVSAFDRAAIDYVLKPVQSERLATTCERLIRVLRQRQLEQSTTETSATDEDQALQALRALSQPTQASLPPLKVIQAAVGTGLQMVQIQDVLYFEAADKYVRVITQQADANSAELLIRTPLRELIPRLDGDQFWQIHRSIVVNVQAIDRVSRVYGRLRVHVRGRSETLEVSRMYAQLFKAM